MGIEFIESDVLDAFEKMESASFDGCLCDPPYALSRGKKGMYGLDWDKELPSLKSWQELYRILKPGAYLLAFGATRTYHRLASLIEHAGFEIRDCVMYLYGSGMPKSTNISKLIDKRLGAEPTIVGQNPNYRPAHKKGGRGFDKETGKQSLEGMFITEPTTLQAKQFEGYGTGLRPAYEPIVVAMKPVDGTYIDNALEHGLAGMNIDGSKLVGADGLLRWPSNVVIDDTAANDLSKTARYFYCAKPSAANRKLDCGDLYWIKEGNQYRKVNNRNQATHIGNIHPTLKPMELCEYLAQLIKPPKDDSKLIVPFSGSGTEAIAGLRAGWSEIVGIEQVSIYVEIARVRARYWARN